MPSRSNAVDGIGPAVVPGARQRRFELLEAAPRDIGQQLVAVAEMAVGRRRADAGPARGLGEGEARRALLGDQFQRRADQRLLEIAVVVAARTRRAAVFGPAHVKSLHDGRRRVDSIAQHLSRRVAS